ncbi:hypothetical protein RCL_jg22527.t1 [Rhizophagus clarus]|uniref:Uncharacterized protein n=1 Tax=Rhizophagus clarus TaxID=94130 RepID=A0A8H3R8D2_9GLOM|nr:hypothetical protein RCL_jg22527.t1 [Rhizophagus clarus]
MIITSYQFQGTGKPPNHETDAGDGIFPYKEENDYGLESSPLASAHKTYYDYPYLNGTVITNEILGSDIM